ncbi:hypothetical protein AGDE_08780 [Angomonas deanei]|uniref:Uncharacterized protein n=1 Tax=Angomonas deanei TaxID=59799 RepID=A0A7G2C2J7_9TRYP|nr:hypothetical protein AGDE_08780 [Angomonas deanei]CAD2213960.1 hypothetical protein, conserved [Angomonas deanei]|eukprot:EPY32263.1 hypothetical protein AGDE_08780 [Angomonas deanei]
MSAMIGVTFLAVAKVIVAVLIGAFSCDSIPNTAATIKDLSFMISVVLLPALTIYNVAAAITIELLVRCSILLVFSVIMILIGLVSGDIIARFLFVLPVEDSGIPAELSKDVRLTLAYKDKRNKREPYVAVVLSDRLEELGVSGRDVVAGLCVPRTTVEDGPGHYWGCLVAMSILNTITLPLSIVQNLATSLEWVELEEATAYMFVFSIVGTVHIWGFGPLVVEFAKAKTQKLKTVRHLMEKHMQRLDQCDASTQTAAYRPSLYSPIRKTAVEGTFPSEAPVEESEQDKGTHPMTPAVAVHPSLTELEEPEAETLPYDWEIEGILKVVYESDMREADALERQSWARKAARSLHSLGISLGTNMPFMSTVVAIVIGIIPFVRNLFFGGPLTMVMDAIALIASGNIPASCCCWEPTW